MAKVRLGRHGVRTAEDVLADHDDRLETLERRSIEPDVEPRGAAGDGFVAEYTVTLEGSPDQDQYAPMSAHYMHPQGARVVGAAVWVENGYGIVQFSTPTNQVFMAVSNAPPIDHGWMTTTAPAGVMLGADQPELFVEAFGLDSSPLFHVQVRFEPLDGGP